jgi:hypothetical protein
MRAASRVLIAVLLVFSLGLHWAALQTVAWAGMLIAYSQGAPLREAVSKTFDGEHPCALCHLVAEGRQEERRQDQKPLKHDKLPDLGVVWQAPEFRFAGAFPRVPSRDLFGSTRFNVPPKPPPRP